MPEDKQEVLAKVKKNLNVMLEKTFLYFVRFQGMSQCFENVNTFILILP